MRSEHIFWTLDIYHEPNFAPRWIWQDELAQQREKRRLEREERKKQREAESIKADADRQKAREERRKKRESGKITQPNKRNIFRNSKTVNSISTFYFFG